MVRHFLETSVFGSVLLTAFFLSACRTTADFSDGTHQIDTNQQEILFEENFSEDLTDWVWSGPPGTKIEIRDGALLIDPLNASHRSPGIEGVNLWHRSSIHGNFALEFDLEPLEPGPDDGESCNLLFMFNYRLADESLDFAKTVSREPGHYPYLHGRNVQRLEDPLGIPYFEKSGYTITYYRINPDGDPPYRMVVRRNPGFYLIAEKVQTAEDQWPFLHTIRIERRGSEIRFFQNGKLVLKAVDSEAGSLPNHGHFGLRSWKTKLKIHAVRAYQLVSDA